MKRGHEILKIMFLKEQANCIFSVPVIRAACRVEVDGKHRFQ